MFANENVPLQTSTMVTQSTVVSDAETLKDSDNIANSGIVFAFGKLHTQQPQDFALSENALFTLSSALYPLKFFLRQDCITNVACGDEHSVFISKSGRVFVIGKNNMGQLGLDMETTKVVTRPVCVKSLKSDRAYQVGCGAEHTLLAIYKPDGSRQVVAFGANGYCQLGIGRNAGEMCATPQVVLQNMEEDVLVLDGGRSHSAAVTSNHKLLVWGEAPEGQLGLGEQTLLAEFPVTVDPPVGYNGFLSISCGIYSLVFFNDLFYNISKCRILSFPFHF